jgi:osmotically-inducible protein OsmY
MRDIDLLGALKRALARDPALADCGIWPDGDDHARTSILSPEGWTGGITVAVRAGVAMLDGEVPSLLHRRLAEVLVRRFPGCLDVVNRIQVVPAEEDSEEKLACAVRAALSRSGEGRAQQISLRLRGSTVLLEGTVDTPLDAERAERLAGYVPGVQRVINRLVVEPPVRGKA